MLQKTGQERLRTEIMKHQPKLDQRYLSTIRPTTVLKGQQTVCNAGAASAILNTLLLEAMKEKEVIEAFNSLDVSPIPYFDTSYKPPADELASVPEDAPGNSIIQSAAGMDNAPKDEFKHVAGMLMTETIFNLMCEAAHGIFDVKTVPRKVVTAGMSIKTVAEEEK